MSVALAVIEREQRHLVYSHRANSVGQLTTDDIARELRARGVFVDHDVNNARFPLLASAICFSVVSVGPTSVRECAVRLASAGLKIPKVEEAIQIADECLTGKLPFNSLSRELKEPFILIPHEPVWAGHPYFSYLVLCVSLFPSNHGMFLRSIEGGFTGYMVAGVVPRTSFRRPRRLSRLRF